MNRTLLLFALPFAFSTSVVAAELQLSPRFSLENEFSMPESAVIDEASEWIYVSNVNVYAKDGNGFISRVRTDGTELTLHWLDGLDSPTGLAIRGNTLFLADYDQLVEVDLISAQIVQRYPSPDTDPVLNDVAIAPDGEVYVSGSGSRTIYQLNNSALEIWLHDGELLQFANGLLITETQIMHGGQTWTVFDRNSKAATDQLQNIRRSLSDIDGITTDTCGGLFITTVPSDQLWWADSMGNVVATNTGSVDGIDLHRRGNLLAVPRVGNTLTLYEITQQCQ